MRDRERKIFWYELRHQLTQLCLYHLAVTAKSRVFAWSLHANKGHNWLDLTAVYVLYFLEQHLFQSLHFCTALSNLIGTWEMKREPFTTYPKWDPSFIHNLLLPKCLHLGSGSWIRIFVFNAYNSGNRGPTSEVLCLWRHWISAPHSILLSLQIWSTNDIQSKCVLEKAILSLHGL